jgi:hypothetical protein
MADQRLILISRDDILDVKAPRDQQRLYRRLARLSRLGFGLLATAPQPDQWSSKQAGPDNALLGPDSIRRQLSDAGGLLDGIYYVPRSLMTQRRNREDALRDIMARYGIDASNIYLFSSSRKWAEMASHLGMNVTVLGGKGDLVSAVKSLLDQK